MTEEMNTWEFSTGLADDFDGTVVSARFTYNERYQSGQVPVLELSIKPDDDDVATEDDGTVNALYPLNKDNWEVGERGAIARYIGKGKARMSNQSGVALLANAMAECDPAVRAKGMPHEAALYVGFSGHWLRKEFGSGEYKTTRLLPTEGTAGEKKAGKGNAKGAGKGKAEADAKAESADLKLTGAARAKLVAAAADYETHEEFIEGIWPDVEGDAAKEAAVLDPSEDGIWARAQG